MATLRPTGVFTDGAPMPHPAGLAGAPVSPSVYAGGGWMSRLPRWLNRMGDELSVEGLHRSFGSRPLPRPTACEVALERAGVVRGMPAHPRGRSAADAHVHLEP